jgi:hypothetical protein
VGLEVFVFWYQDGEQVGMPFDHVLKAFGAAAGPPDAVGFRVSYGAQGEAYVYAKRGGDGLVASVMVEASGAAELWDAIVEVVRLGHGLCVWPGDAQAIAAPESLPHLPAEVRDTLEPQVVQDGAALLTLIENS